VAVVPGNKRIKIRLDAWIFRIEKFAGGMLAIFGILLALD
jgi:hypothetical protein